MHLLGTVLINFCVSLTELRDAQRAGNTLFLDVSLTVFLEEIII